MKRNWSPKAVIILFIALFLLLSFITSLMGLNYKWFSLNENQILYLFSTSAQVIAGIYGLTLTGFIFFRNELSREEFEDETLVEAVESLKQRYFSLLIFITACVIVTLLLASLAISNESAKDSFLKNTMIINIGQSAFATSLLAIAYFIYEVISPKRIELASRTLQKQIDPSRDDNLEGSLVDFLRNYNRIERLLSDFGLFDQENSDLKYERKFRRRNISNSKLAEILFRSKQISEVLYKRIRNLITLRNSIIHGADLVVSQEMVQSSNQVLQELKLALGVFDDEN